MPSIMDMITERIVVLEGCHCPVPQFDGSHHRVEHYQTQPNEVAERIRDATVVITTIVPVLPEHVEQSPRLKLLVIMGTGCGWVDQDYFASKGITVCNTPHSNIESVSGHALGMYFATRRKFLPMHNLVTKTDTWEKETTLTKRWENGAPPGLAQEIVGIIGYGALGQAIEKLCRGVGMGEIAIAERKGAKNDEVRPGRELFEELVKRATVLFICCPKQPSTTDLIHDAELHAMKKEALIINVARGGIVNEELLAKALKGGRIAGAATDVFEVEPAERGKSPLLPIDEEIPNLLVSPHLSWFAQQTLKNLQRMLKEVVNGFNKGNPVNVVVSPKS